MPKQLPDNSKAEHKRLRKLYLDTLTTPRKQLEVLDTLERDTHRAYKAGNIPHEHYHLMLANIAERRLIAGVALDKHENKIDAIKYAEYVEDANKKYLDMFLNGECIAEYLLKE